LIQLKDPLGPDEKLVHHFGNENGIYQSNAYGIGQSADGRIWVGGGRLWAFDGTVWSAIEEEELQEYVNEIYSIDGLLLVGSRYYGVYLYDGQDWTHYDTESGLISNTIISLYADSDSSIWAVTENDISRFDGHKWVNHVLPADLNLDFEGGELMRSQDGACWVNKAPREWKRRALTYNQLLPSSSDQFITYRYLPDKNPPETAFLNHLEEIAAEGDVMLAWQGNDYLSLTGKEALEYSYRIDDGPWSPFSPESKHMFTNLDGGMHRMEVRARDLDFNIDPTPAQISLRVQVPVWQESWFWGLIVMFLVTLGIFEYRILVKNRTLGRLNQTLRQANWNLQEKGARILDQNQHILQQQAEIIQQKNRLEKAHQHLAASHDRIEQQRDTLKDMVSEVEQLSKAKLNFFTNISHELRTPLTLLMGPVEQLIRSGDHMSVDHRLELLQLISRNSSRLLILINQLLEIRKIESSSLGCSPRPGNLRQVVENTLDLFRNLVEMRQIQLMMTNQLPQPWLSFDHDKLEKILANLLSNALKHTLDYGHVQLSLSVAAQATLSTGQFEGPWLCLEVADDGQGIPAKDRAHVFDRYYTGQPGAPLSTGIGLSYIHDLVQVQGGHIDLESEEGAGTIVTVYLPYQTCTKEEVQPTSAKSDTLPEAALHVVSMTKQLATDTPTATQAESTKHLLIVEDNADMRRFLASLFEDTYEVIEASNGQEGLEVARKQTIDIVISDIMMPEMDGITFCRHLKTDLLTSHIPVILLTAKGRAAQKVDGYHTGADDYITKPFQPEVLEARVQNLLEQRKRLHRLHQQQFMMKPQEVTLDSPDDRMLARLSKLMEEHVDDPEFNVNKMCEAVDMSHMQFIRKIKQLTGKKPVELLKSFRLTRAKDLLRQNKLTISEVAYLVGYDLPNSFSRAFKKDFGISPTEFLEREVTESVGAS
jgi:signal transduction histidine kinase/DNA-binding response OmpR family regulator